MKTLLSKIRSQLKRQASAKKALEMQAYMKSEMPYHGVQAPEVKKIAREAFKDFEYTEENWRESVLYLWRNAKFREERYLALNLCRQTKAREFQTSKNLKMYEEMIVDGAWWDYVDDISSRVGEILKNEPEKMKKKMLQWGRSKNMWKRRVSIICQLKFKAETDTDLLYRSIEESMGSDEFFLRKAIGWALREYAKTDSKEVKRFVKANRDRLSPLSQREALKNLK